MNSRNAQSVLTRGMAETRPGFDSSLDPARRGTIPDWVVAAMGYLGLAVLLRLPVYGNPVVHIDEQFYLLVGERMLHGDLPFVDIWDRKPPGLFVLYAAMRLLGEGFVPYQLVATAFAAATSLAIRQTALQIAPPRAASLAGAAYLAFMGIFDVAGGQTPVFYDLPMAVAGMMLAPVMARPRAGSLRRAGLGAMALVGLALQIKYSAVFEGVAFGIALIWRGWRDGRTGGWLAQSIALWVAAALAPTALAFGIYAALGHGQAFFDSNFVSIFERASYPHEAYAELVRELLVITPFWMALARTFRPSFGRSHAGVPGHLRFLRYWALAAFAGFLAFGTYYDHYIVPVLVPLSIVVAPAFDASRWGRGIAAFMVGGGIIASPIVELVNRHLRGDAEDVAKATALIDQHIGNGCLYIYEDDPIFYLTTHSCLLTRFVFPPHLNIGQESEALGIDTAREEARIMALRPTVVLITDHPLSNHPNVATLHVIHDALDRDYVRYARFDLGTRPYSLYRLADPAKPQTTP